MNEHLPAKSSPEASPAAEHETPDWRRLEVARGRFATRIDDGITRALKTKTDIDQTTARCIAHVLGRAHGRQSHLAEFGRTGEGEYVAMRDEYVGIYKDDRAGAATRELVDWFGAHLVQRENLGSSRRFMNEHLPPKLALLLAPASVRVGEDFFTVHVPADWDGAAIDGLVNTLAELQLPQDDALQAFLALPDVSAGTANIMESFHEAFAGTYASEEAALRALSPLEDWENGLADWCIDNGVDFDALEWNNEPLMARLRDIYDVVGLKEVLHVFIK